MNFAHIPLVLYISLPLSFLCNRLPTGWIPTIIRFPIDLVAVLSLGITCALRVQAAINNQDDDDESSSSSSDSEDSTTVYEPPTGIKEADLHEKRE